VTGVPASRNAVTLRSLQDLYHDFRIVRRG
jgi:hypothetical protein